MADAEIEDEAIMQLRMRQAKALPNVTLLKSPILTAYYFARYAINGLYNGAKWLGSHPVTVLVLLPALATYITMKCTGYHQGLLYEIEEAIKYVMWWLGLGILSSIGLGTGMHTGLLFLFPHILKVCLAAETCGHVRFSTRHDMWYSRESFKCGAGPAEEVAFGDLVRKVMMASMLWGIGTAIGEIPPYWLSYSAAVAGEKNVAMDELEQAIRASQTANLFQRTVAHLELWMVGFIQQRDFWGILALASWPNAAFDLCGLVCGNFKFPFWKFFGATLIGKGFIKVTGQVLFFVSLFRRHSREALLAWFESVLPARLPGLGGPEGASPAHILHQLINKSIAQYQDKVLDKTSSSLFQPQVWWFQGMLRDPHTMRRLALNLLPDSIADAWSGLMAALMALFAVSCVNAFAQAYRAQLDEADVEAHRRWLRHQRKCQ